MDTGAPVTDHIRSEQNALTLTVLFTDLPIILGQDGSGMDWGVVDLPLDVPTPTPVFSPGTALAAGVGAAIGAVGGLLGIPGLAGPSARHLDWSGKDYLGEAWDVLAAIRDDRELVQVVTSTATYDDVALRSFSWAKAADSTSATAELAFVALSKAATASVALAKVSSLAAAAKKATGAAKTATPAGDDRTALLRLLTGAGDYITNF